ncbi:hypothetical protein WKW79_06755 [Variovorax robiniae]|uniref:Uncharacterized protein n=1 Tax=Variovorax robiniae TaxID=1836199 RepID=A0ABU8X373_9BURK
MTTDAIPFGNWNPTDVWRQWLQLAPNSLVQPILPVTFNINSNNSTAPQTEANVVAVHSYGRQIGRISDALRALILAEHPTPAEREPFADFLAMWDEIEQVKTGSATARLEQIASDLALLKKKDREEFKRVRDAMQQALDGTK